MGTNKRAITFFSVFFFFFSLVSSMASAVSAAASETDKSSEQLAIAASHNSTDPLQSKESSPVGDLLSRYNPRSPMTCDKYPKVCHSKGSPGHHCCNKRCISLKKDNLNCGQCGKRCKYGEKCCHSKCVNILYDRSNCGGCHHRCNKGSYCKFGMCSYA